jgi:deazaflavin-dependent oxidoreductase (nitroreductase family)
MLGVPCLMLRTTGRKTGPTRTNSLVYAKDGDRYLVVASKGGDAKAPAWLLNLRAKPEVQVQIGRTRFQAAGTEIAARRTPVCGSSSTTTTATATTLTRSRRRARSRSSP